MKIKVIANAAGEIQAIMQAVPQQTPKGPTARYILKPDERLHEVEVPAEFAKLSLLELHMNTRLESKGDKPFLVKAVKA